MTTCKMCGNCCIFEDGTVCPYLVTISKTRKICRIYKTRFTRQFRVGSKVIMCHTREESPNDYVDCPFNTGKPILKKV